MPNERLIFADTSFYYAALDKRDRNHQSAQRLSRYVAEHCWTLTSSWEVIVETVTLLRNRYSYEASVNFIKKILPCLEIVYIDDTIRKRALSFFEKLNRDKRLSLCDVISYLLVKEHFENIPCLAFDDDFDQLGLNVLRQD